MKHLFKSSFFKSMLTILIVMLLVKILWLIVEINWLSSEGLDHEEKAGGKSLYYRVKLTPNDALVPKKAEKKVVKIAGSIKDIRLIAVYNASDSTVITVEYKRKTKILGRGDEINGFTLIGGGSTYATFTKAGKTYRVDLTKAKKSASSKGSITPSKTHSSGRPARSQNQAAPVKGEIVDAGDHKIVDKSLLDHYASNMDDIYKNIGITEFKENGKLKGFKITFVKRGSPFSKLGLKRGDVIKSINGEEIDSYSAAFNTYKNIKDVDNLSLVILRGKKEMELEYEIN